MNKLDILKNYKFQINDRVYSKDYAENGTIVSLTQHIVFNEDTNEHEIANCYGINFDNDDEKIPYSLCEDDLKLIPRSLKYPAIYKHFKDQYYAVIGISIPSPTVDFDNTIEIARHTEDNELIGICLEEGKYVHLCNQSKDILVIYRPLYLSSRDHLYVRPLEMFMNEVDREKYPDVIQRYRFEEVK